MKPRFTAQFVFHYMGPDRITRNFEEMTRAMQHDREYERYGTAYDDDTDTVSEMVAEMLADDNKLVLKDGDYIMVLLTGVLDYHTHTDYWSGGTETDLEVDVEWTFMRVMERDEQRRCDDMNGIMPNVPLALYTEVEWEYPWTWPTRQKEFLSNFLQPVAKN